MKNSKKIKIKLILAILIILVLIVVTSYFYYLGNEFYKFTYTQKYKVLLKDIFITFLIVIFFLSAYTIGNKNNKNFFIGGLLLILIVIILEICVYILYKQSLNLRTIKDVKLVRAMTVKLDKDSDPLIYVYDDNNQRYEVKINKTWLNDFFLINEDSNNKENILLHNLVSTDQDHKNLYDLKVYGYSFIKKYRFPIIYNYKITNK